MSPTDSRARLREWILSQNGKLSPDALRDDTPLIEERIISSVQTLDLILFLEQLSGRPVDVEQLKPGAFRDINTICERFLA